MKVLIVGDTGFVVGCFLPIVKDKPSAVERGYADIRAFLG